MTALGAVRLALVDVPAYCSSHDARTVVLAAATRRRALELFDDLEHELTRHLYARVSVRRSAGAERIEWENGTRVVVRTLSTARSSSAWRGVIVDRIVLPADTVLTHDELALVLPCTLTEWSAGRG